MLLYVLQQHYYVETFGIWYHALSPHQASQILYQISSEREYSQILCGVINRLPYQFTMQSYMKDKTIIWLG